VSGNGVAPIRWELPGPYDVAFTTRAGGVSEGPYESLNLGAHTADAADRVFENRRRAFAAVGADPGDAAMARQVHGATVRKAQPTTVVEDRPRPECDALWTDEPGTALMLLTADCLPIALVRTSGERPALAVLHAGWRGLLAGLPAAGVAALGGEVAAVVGPGIGPCCYEVGPEVGEPFRAAFGGDVVRGRNLDLWTAAERALKAAGCTRVERVDLCTACHPDRFFSYRRDAGVTGRQGVIARVAG
jgi:YfiH family protein